MARGEAKRVGWFPLRGSWEESVLSWNEQVDMALRRRVTDLEARERRLQALRAEQDSSGDLMLAKEELKQVSLAT